MADQSLKDMAYRGLAAAIGGPVDLTTMLMRPFGYSLPDEQVIGGSEWIGKKMEGMGIVGEARNPTAEFAASLLVPAGLAARAVKTVGSIPDVVKSVSRSRMEGIDNVNIAARPTESAGSRVALDYEGRPLGAEYVVGRRYEGAGEYPLEFKESLDATEKLGAKWRELTDVGRNTLGKFVRSSDSAGNAVREILLKKGLEGKAEGVYQHEFGHLIDDLVYGGAIKTEGLKKQFANIYSELNKPFRGKGMFTSKEAGYSGADIDREHVAEAIRLYLQNPEHLKKIAPDVAKRIRDSVNSNTNINRVVQFNAGAFAPLVPMEFMGAEENGNRLADQ